MQRHEWPGFLIDLYDRTKTRAEFRTAAMAEAINQSERTCEIDFYLGEFEAYLGSKDEARKLLKDAISECRRHDINSLAAKAEIDRIGRR